MIALWYSIVGLMFAMFIVRDGWDFGAGAIHLMVARNNAERRQVFAAIGPLWSWNEVWLVAAGGVLAGALTHLVWDGFTHDGGRGVRMFPVLDDTLDIGSRHIPATYVMQDLGSLIGLAAVLAMLCFGLRRGRQAAVPNRLMLNRERLMWMLLYAVAAGIFTAAFYLWVNRGQPPIHGIVARASGAAVASLRGLAAALLCVSLALDLRLRQLHYRSSGPDR